MSDERLCRGVGLHYYQYYYYYYYYKELSIILMSKCLNQWPTGTEVVARYNFIGKADEDLSFQKGDIITITHQTRVRLNSIINMSYI